MHILCFGNGVLGHIRMSDFFLLFFFKSPAKILMAVMTLS